MDLSKLTGWYFVVCTCSLELLERAIERVILCSTVDLGFLSLPLGWVEVVLCWY